uniref:Fibroblast growth factor binding protein 1a n=1 Tax=Kryptolebias marmoratus TaxID=37003 RepID=A0A3Q3FEP1_KRYMA
MLYIQTAWFEMLRSNAERQWSPRGKTFYVAVKKSAQSDGGRKPSIWDEPIKFTTKNKDKCTMIITGEDLVILNVSCKKGERSFGCEYAARPSVCPQYSSRKELFWTQILRALKKRKNLCQENSGLVRAGVCKGAGREAHFRLCAAQKMNTTSSYIPPFATKAVKSCQPDNRKLAEQLCTDSWSAVCTFFFTMVKDSDC